LGHRAFRSRARMVHGTVYDVPASIGPVDVATFGCILLHLRDPFLALARVLPLVRERAVLVEFLGPAPEAPSAPAPRPSWSRALRRVKRGLGLAPRPAAPAPPPEPGMVFLPDPPDGPPKGSWR